MSALQLVRVRELESTARAWEIEAQNRESRLKDAERALEAASAPYDERITAIMREREQAVAALSAEKEAAYKFLWQPVTVDGREKSVRQAASEAREAADAAEASTHIPTDAKSFAEFVSAGAEPFRARRVWGLRAREPVAVSSYLLFSGTEADDGGDKFYLVTTQDHAAIAGWLRVTPSQHRGDYTTARGEWDGKPFLVRKSYRGELTAPSLEVDSCPQPLAQLKAKILGVAFDLKNGGA